MSLSARFEKANEKATTSNTSSAKPTRTVVRTAQPSKPQQGGVKQAQRKVIDGKKANQQQKPGKNKPAGGTRPKKQEAPKKKTVEEMDREIETYTLGKAGAQAARMDAEMEEYNAARKAAAAAGSSAAPES